MHQLSVQIVDIIQSARNKVAAYINFEMVIAYFEIGKILVEEIQDGSNRASYGDKVLIQVSEDLTNQFGRGFSTQNLERMRNFYLVYSKSSNHLRKSETLEKNPRLV